jgi:hypothetical protein
MPKWLKIVLASLPAIVDLIDQIYHEFFPDVPADPETTPSKD